MPTASRRRILPLLLALLVAGVALSGCARIRTALAVQPDDTITGEIVIAMPQQNAEDRGPAITVPPELASDVDVSEYRQDGYTGSLLRFSGLTFEQVAQLHTVAGAGGDGVRFEMRRVGNRVHVYGSVDLTTVSVDRADFQLKIGFPGQVIESNGDADSNEVSWTFTPGEVGEVNAVVAYADPNAPSAADWTLGLGGLVAAAALTVVVFARRLRNPPVNRP